MSADPLDGLATAADRLSLLIAESGECAKQLSNAAALGATKLIELSRALSDVGDHALASRALADAEEVRAMMATVLRPEDTA